MALLRESDLPSFLRSRSTSPVVVLVYGSDSSLVSALSQRTLAGLAPGSEVRRMAMAAVASDPALLLDTVMSVSMFGDRQCFLVEECDDRLAELLPPLLSGSALSGPLVLTAGALSKSSKLRLLIEAAPSAYCLPAYEPKSADVARRVAQQLAAHGQRLADEAATAFVALLRGSGVALDSEVEKLSLYAHGRDVLTLDDVLACVGDQSGGDLDRVTAAMLAGDFESLDQNVSELGEPEQRSLLPILSQYLQRLQAIRSEFEQSGNLEAAMRSARPPVFFAIKDTVAGQVERLTLDQLLDFQFRCEACVEQSRRLPNLGLPLLGRLAFSFAQSVRMNR